MNDVSQEVNPQISELICIEEDNQLVLARRMVEIKLFG